MPREFKMVTPQLVDAVEKRYRVIWPETPTKPLWHVIDEEGRYSSLCLHPSRDSANASLFIIKRTNFSEVKVRPTGWPSSLSRHCKASTLPSRSKNGETLMTYSPQWLVRHSGFCQGEVWVSGGSCIDVWYTESRYVGGG